MADETNELGAEVSAPHKTRAINNIQFIIDSCEPLDSRRICAETALQLICDHWKPVEPERTPSFKVGDYVQVEGSGRGTVTSINENDAFRYEIAFEASPIRGWYKHCQLRHVERTASPAASLIDELRDVRLSPSAARILDMKIQPSSLAFSDRMWAIIHGQVEKKLIADTLVNIIERLEFVEAQLRTKTVPSADKPQ